MRNLFKTFLFTCCISSALAQEADDLSSVSILLKRASQALQEKNYKGRFTYEFGSTLETLELVHAVKDGVEYERVSHLSGVEREFLRSGRKLDCVSSGGFLLRGGLISSSHGIIALSQNYRFYLQGEERIAGRESTVIKVIPKDEFRYGLTLAVDLESGLPLMSLTTASSKVALERFQFVQIEVDEAIDDQDLQPVESKYRTLDGNSSPCSKDPIQSSPWMATWLPPGFVLPQVSNDPHGGSVLTFTDGIASFTVFISIVDATASVKQGVALRGATIALMSVMPYKLQQVSVILVGEIPLVTADRVANSIMKIK
jgi:sigma-E factor negative regulatory protein RseB